MNLCFQLRFALNSLYIRNLRTSEVTRNLVLKVNTVIHYQHSRRLQVLL